MALTPFTPFHYPSPPCEPPDVAVTIQHFENVDIVTIHCSHKAEGLCSPEPLPAYPCYLLHYRQDGWLCWKLLDGKKTEQRAFNVNRSVMDTTRTRCSPLMPKPTVQPWAHPPCREWQFPWKSPVLVANSRHATIGTLLARSLKRIEPCAHLILSHPLRYTVLAHLTPSSGQKFLRCRLQKLSARLLSARHTIRCRVSTWNERSQAPRSPDSLETTVLHASSSSLCEAASHVILCPVSQPGLL
jgi:hypothetical protein